LLFEIPEFGLYVWISAFDTKLAHVEHVLQRIQEKLPGVCAQLVDLDRVAGSRYLFLATFNAIKSFHTNQPISRSLGLEILLYVAANRQISVSLIRVGITANTRRIAALAVGDSTDLVSAAEGLLAELLKSRSLDELVDEWPPQRVDNVLSGFGIGDKEVRAIIRKGEARTKAIERLAIERSAMLALKK
jgi:tRNA threonylcarbamoyladenosine modification (KEOPS) complex Cgi121 subunit